MNSYLQYERHKTPASMLIESLDEQLYTVEFCLQYWKNDREMWPEPHSSGVLGMPAAILLFSIVDAIGGYFKGNRNIMLKIPIDGKMQPIRGASYRHFYILNSDYFGLCLTDKEIKQFYDFGRSRLMHNGVLGKEVTLSLSDKIPFLEANSWTGKGRYSVHLLAFFQACKEAVKKFKENIHEIVPYSEEGGEFKQKK